MNAPDQALGLSHALGFWNKHCEAMDAVYDMYDPDIPAEADVDADTPSELAELWSDEGIRNQLIGVLERGEFDRDRLLDACFAAVVATFSRPGSPLKVAAHRGRDPWKKVAFASPVRGKLSQAPIWLSVEFDSVSLKEYYLVTSIWAKGGKATHYLFRDALGAKVDPPREVAENWASASAFLSCLRIGDYARGDAGIVDLDSVLAALKADLGKFNAEGVKRMVDALRAA